jgi:hypothetical protein
MFATNRTTSNTRNEIVSIRNAIYFDSAWRTALVMNDVGIPTIKRIPPAGASLRVIWGCESCDYSQE